MHRSTLFELLRKFNKEELKDFENFVSSPYFNPKTAVTKFWKAIKKYAPEFESSSIDREKIYKKVFPDKPYNYGTVKNLFFDLTKLAEGFLIIEELKKDKYQMNKNLLAQLNSRDLGRLFGLKLKDAEELLKKFDGNFQEYYFILSSLAKQKTNFNFFHSAKELNTEDFQKTSEYLIYYFLVTFFSAYNDSTAAGKMTKTLEKDIFLENFFRNIDIEAVLNSVKEKSYKDYLNIMFGYKKYLALSHPELPENYFDFKEYLIQNLDSLSKEEKYNQVNSLVTSLTLLEFDPAAKTIEHNEIHKLRFTHNIVLSSDGHLSLLIYSSVVSNAGRLKDYDFLEKFVKRYHDKLPEQYRENMKNFELVYLHYAKNDFSKSLQYLNKIDFQLFQFKHYVKNLQMALYYETSDYESFSYLKDSYKHFLAKKEDITDRDRNLNFIHYIDNLFRLKQNRNKQEAEFLKIKVLADNNVSMKHWLLEKTDEISK